MEKGDEKKMRWLGSITDSMDMNLSNFWDSWGQKRCAMKSQSRTWLSTWTTFFFKDSDISNTMWYLCFFVWLASLSMLISKSTQVAANDTISFFFVAMWYSIVHTHTHTHTHYIFLIHSFVSGHLVCFHVFAIVNSASVNTDVSVSFRIVVFSGITVSHSITIFSFLKILHSDSSNLHSHQQCWRAPFSKEIIFNSWYSNRLKSPEYMLNFKSSTLIEMIIWFSYLFCLLN